MYNEPHQGILIFFPFFILPLKGFLVEFWVGMKLRHICITYFAKSKTKSKKIQVIHFDQDVQVCGFL
jgi:hypothetical protein